MMLRRRSLAPSINPSRPNSNIPHSQASLARRWQHTFPRPVFQHLIQWKSICTPACLPLTIEYYPPEAELISSYQVYEYDILVAGIDMSASFMLRKPNEAAGEDWPLLIMREMAALRLAQGFQFIVAPFGQESVLEILDPATQLRRLLDSPALTSGKAYSTFPLGASDVLKTTKHPVYLSMSNQIHVLEYKEMEQVVKVQRYVRRTTHSTQPYEYTCLVWPKLGDGYTEVEATFNFPSLELYGWNRMDMLIAGYQQDFTDSLRYWRTRFLVIPSLTPPPPMHAPSGERLSEEEVRLLGIDKLAELFTKARWVPHDIPNSAPAPPAAAVRFLPTWLEPSASVLDNTLMTQLEEIHADGPLRKNTKHDRNLEDASLAVVAKAMREDPPDGVPFKDYTWQKVTYFDSFTGYEFVSWLVREWRDVSTREQGVEWGTRLLERGLFEHCRGHHGFLDGHYFYHLRGDYSPAPWLLRSPSQNSQDLSEKQTEASQPSEKQTEASQLSEKATAPPPFKTSSPAKNSKRRRLVMSQTMIIDVDMNTDTTKRSDRAQSVILHHDIIHNPAIAFHFEINWIGTTARCIDDTLQMWSRTIERYGLKLVEAYVDEIIDIRRQNIFQSTFPVPLCIAPPPLPPGSTSQDPQYYETAILRHFGFILDIEAANRYSDTVDVFYSYRRKRFTHSQFVHKTGLAFVQIVGGKEGFRWLTNRLFVASNSRSGQTKTNTTADELRVELFEFCSDRERVKAFYEDVTLQLQTV